MSRTVLVLLGLLLASLVSCASGGGPEQKSGEWWMSLEELKTEILPCDVVLFGEEHDNFFGHRQRYLLFERLHAERPDMILTLEMFQRDVQPVLTQYLVGEIDEATFLKASRAPRGYAERYRPYVEYAKAHGIPVLAANVPDALRRQMRKDGWESIQGNPHVARKTTAPKNAYWERFKAAMHGHPGTEDQLYTAYRAQCLWDDTMAETISDALKEAHAAGRKPLVVHLVGQFHVKDDGGTKAKLLERQPELKVAVLTMRSEPNVRQLPGGDYELLLPEQPKRVMPKGHGARAAQ